MYYLIDNFAQLFYNKYVYGKGVMHVIRSMRETDAEAVLRIYAEGVNACLPTFTAVVPTWETWSAGHRKECRLVAEEDGQVLGFAVLSVNHLAPAYDGVAELSIYLDKKARGRGLGTQLMNALIEESEKCGIWTLESIIVADNLPSIHMHEKLGFRFYGYRERVSYTKDGIWHDTVLYERRSKKVAMDGKYIPAPAEVLAKMKLPTALSIRPACAEEIPLLQGIFDSARAFMRKSGNMTQWSGGYPSDEQLLTDIESGALHVCMENGVPCGVFALCGHEPTYDVIEGGQWPDNDPYVTVHRLAVAGRGHGVGSFCLQFAKDKGVNVRADTHRDNIPMQKLLLKNGFVYCGIIHLKDGDERLAYQYTRTPKKDC